MLAITCTIEQNLFVSGEGLLITVGGGGGGLHNFKRVGLQPKIIQLILTAHGSIFGAWASFRRRLNIRVLIKGAVSQNFQRFCCTQTCLKID